MVKYGLNTYYPITKALWYQKRGGDRWYLPDYKTWCDFQDRKKANRKETATKKANKAVWHYFCDQNKGGCGAWNYC